MNMIEKVARAVAKEIDNTDEFWDMPENIDVAKAAIEAMREPTEEMIQKGIGNNPTSWTEGTDKSFPRDVVNDVYRSMVKEALNE